MFHLLKDTLKGDTLRWLGFICLRDFSNLLRDVSRRGRRYLDVAEYGNCGYQCSTNEKN